MGGEIIDETRLGMVDKSEQLLLDMGFHQVRVRVHGEGKSSVARIEITPDEFPIIIQNEVCQKIYDYLKKLGFAYITLDLGGYRTGSMNETIEKDLSL